MACKEHFAALFHNKRLWQSLQAKRFYWETKDWQTYHSLDRSLPLLSEPSGTHWAGKGWCSAMSSCSWGLHWRLWSQWQPGRKNYKVCNTQYDRIKLRFFFLLIKTSIWLLIILQVIVCKRVWNVPNGSINYLIRGRNQHFLHPHRLKQLQLPYTVDTSIQLFQQEGAATTTAVTSWLVFIASVIQLHSEM